MVIFEIQSDIQAIEKNSALYQETNFDRRVKAIDYVEFNIIDRIDGLLQSSGQQEEMTALGTPGVGIRGMRERLRQLGGSLDINSNGKGTVVVARLPIVGNSATAAA